jgi:hypothetical protein
MEVDSANTYVPIRLQSTYDPLTDLDSDRVIFIEKGGSTVTYQPNPTSAFSTSNITWTIIPPSTNVIIDRQIYVAIPVQFSIVTTSQLPLNTGVFGVRSWPINQCLTSVTTQINGQSVSSQPLEFASALQHSNIFQQATHVNMSTFPSLPDNSQTYAQLAGFSNNVLNNFQNSIYNQQGRGAFPMTVVSNTANLTVFQTVIIEPLMLSPWQIDPTKQVNGLTYVSNLTLTLNFGNVNRMFCLDTTTFTGFTSLATTFFANPKLILKFITPDSTMTIPKTITYPYDSIIAYQSNNISVPAGAITTTPFVSSSLSLDQIPAKMYIFVRRQDADLQGPLGYTFSDSFARITNCNITFNNVGGILSGATESQLYEISVKNGLNLSWPDWSGSGLNIGGVPSAGSVGSILIVKPMSDFGMSDPSLSTGVFGGQFNMAVQVTVQNMNPSAVTYSLFVCVVNNGILTMSAPNVAFLQSGVLTRQEVLMAPDLENTPMHEAVGPLGGSMFGDIKHFTKKVIPNAFKNAHNFIKDNKLISRELGNIPLPGMSSASSLAKSLGYGGKRITAASLRR